MSQEYIELLLNEIHELRSRMDERFDLVYNSLAERGEQIAELKVDMKSLVGNGKKGRVERLEDAVKTLQRYKTILMTYVSVIATAVAALVYRGEAILRWVSHLGR